jgi:hypothetical protein
MRVVAWLLAPSALAHVVACGGTTAAQNPTAAPAVDAAAGGCVGGTWALSETAGACGSCSNIADQVAIEVQVSADGGTVTDSEGNTWTFDPATCSATLTGACDASDAIFFATGTASCTWTCGSFCPPCSASCVLTPAQ